MKIQVYIIITCLALVSCGKINGGKCWDCQRATVSGVQYSDTSFCGKDIPHFRTPDGQEIGALCQEK